MLRLKPLGVEGTVTVMMDSPWEVNGGVKLGTFQLKANAPQVATDVRADVSALCGYGDKHAIYLVFSSPTENRSLCDLMELLTAGIGKGVNAAADLSRHSNLATSGRWSL